MRDPVTDSKLMEHEADGIKELDNNLPTWWVWLFYGAIAFAPVYMWYFHIWGKGDLSIEKYEKEMARVEARAVESAAAAEAAAGPAETNPFAAPSTDDAVLAKGKEIFLVHCIACHTATGGGLVGPNLCDDYFIHGPTYADTVRTVQNGVLEKGMIAWKGVLPPEDIQAVCSYVISLRGTDPPNPKAPEGEQYAEYEL